jgi:hypothetical protein
VKKSSDNLNFEVKETTAKQQHNLRVNGLEKTNERKTTFKLLLRRKKASMKLQGYLDTKTKIEPKLMI